MRVFGRRPQNVIFMYFVDFVAFAKNSSSTSTISNYATMYIFIVKSMRFLLEWLSPVDVRFLLLLLCFCAPSQFHLIVTIQLFKELLNHACHYRLNEWCVRMSVCVCVCARVMHDTKTTATFARSCWLCFCVCVWHMCRVVLFVLHGNWTTAVHAWKNDGLWNDRRGAGENENKVQWSL